MQLSVVVVVVIEVIVAPRFLSRAKLHRFSDYDYDNDNDNDTRALPWAGMCDSVGVATQMNEIAQLKWRQRFR